MSRARKVALVLAAIFVVVALSGFLGLLPLYAHLYRETVTIWLYPTTETTTITVLELPRHTTEPWGPYSRTTITAQNETWIIACWTSTVVWTIWKPSTVVTITHFDTLTTTVYVQKTTGPAQTVTVTTTVTQT